LARPVLRAALALRTIPAHNSANSPPGEQTEERMKKIAVVLAFAIVAFALLAIPLVAGEAEGKAVYASKCAMCHGADGVAKEMIAKKGARNFNDPAWQKEKTDEALTAAITDGIKEKGMPAYKEKLKAEEIQDLVKFVRTLAPAVKK